MLKVKAISLHEAGCDSLATLRDNKPSFRIEKMRPLSKRNKKKGAPDPTASVPLEGNEVLKG